MMYRRVRDDFADELELIAIDDSSREVHEPKRREDQLAFTCVDVERRGVRHGLLDLGELFVCHGAIYAERVRGVKSLIPA